jgi:isopenicillin N synthase-like dioxygenase
MLSAARPASPTEMPVLDLTPLIAGAPLGDLPARLRRACETTGFFYVVNHGVPWTMIERLYDVMRQYFALPYEERMRCEINRDRRGFKPQGVNQHPGYPPDLKESFGFGFDLPADDPDVRAGKPLHSPNQWPIRQPWLREAAEAYQAQVVRLGVKLLELFAISLGLPAEHFRRHFTKPLMTAGLFHYPPQPADTPDNLMGVVPHTDYGMLTILAQDPIGGLEIRKRDGEWIAAPYIDGTLIINLGDLMQRWTNEVYASNQHRVINRSGHERYSVATFFDLDYDTPVVCLETCTSPARPAKYPPIVYGDYMLSRFKDVQKYV